ncbi:MAG TPA: purine-nucleoside phosphorylase [Longimicrobiales bacterium]|nr:purine-nucleoside phosphorylase [Longimicrobiales bacterium]
MNERGGDPGGAADHLARRIGIQPEVALVLGSGLGGLADAVEDAVRIPYGEIPGFTASTVVGHAGRLVAGRMEGRSVLAFQGRHHAYEGHPAAALALPVRTAGALGARVLIATCAAGGVNAEFAAGDLMLFEDHLNLMGQNPLVGPVLPGEERFPDMTRAYDPALRDLAESVADREGIAVTKGVYAALLGPSYETPAEVRMLARLGADAVGMSTVPEVIAARANGMRVLGIALITNPAAGISGLPLSHEEVVAAAAEAAERFQRLVRGVLRELHPA